MDEDSAFVKRQKIIHYGALELKVTEHPAKPAVSGSGQSSQSFTTANIPTILSSEKQYALEELERRKKVRQIAVSTDDNEVRARLRTVNEPMTLFGECPADRRERLRNILLKTGADFYENVAEPEQKSSASESKTWYHEGPQKLLDARWWLAEYSISRTKARLEAARSFAELPENIRDADRHEEYKKLGKFEIGSSQVADQRPISSCTFSPNNQMIATSSWSGLCKVWNLPNLSLSRTMRSHNCNADQVNWHPSATLTNDANDLNLVSCGVDGAVFLWNLAQEEPLHRLKGHEPHRVSQAQFHPSGKYLATACYDHSFRFWDIEKTTEILHQEGHSKAVHDVAFHPDGSLIASAGRDGFGRVWDLRTGRCIMFLEGHLKGIISIDFSPNGYHIVTGSEDNTVKIWNLRERCLDYTIAAHTNIVSKVLFRRNFIVSSSYDSTVKVWAHPSWTPIKTFLGHDGKILSADISTDHKHIVTSSFDRTFKLWEEIFM